MVSSTSSEDDFDLLPAALSISRIDDLLEQMRFHEAPKRALFSIPFELASGLIIGVKGYGLITEQKRGAYKYFVDLGDRMEVVESRTTHVDEVRGHLYAVPCHSYLDHAWPSRSERRRSTRAACSLA